jgi:hypothetical protein
MKPRSAKNKGQGFTKEVQTKICETLQLNPDDVRVVPAGVKGMDLWLSQRAQIDFPFAVECKRQEKIQIWACLEQADSNRTDTLHPMLVFRRNRSKTWACLELETVLKMCKIICDHEDSLTSPF